MAPKKKNKKQPNIRSRIVNLIVENGPRPQRGMTSILGISYQSLNTEILELRRLGVLEKNSDGILSLVEGVDLAQFGFEIPIRSENQSTAETNILESPMLAWCDGPSPPPEKFEKLLKSVGVKTAANVIANLFFNGEIGNLQWLYKVLMVTSEGFVTEDQAKMIMPSWAFFWGIPYNHDEFFGE